MWLARTGQPTRTKAFDNFVNILGFDTIQNIVTASRHVMAILKDRNILLLIVQRMTMEDDYIHGKAYSVFEFFNQSVVLGGDIASIHPEEESINTGRK